MSLPLLQHLIGTKEMMPSEQKQQKEITCQSNEVAQWCVRAEIFKHWKTAISTANEKRSLTNTLNYGVEHVPSLDGAEVQTGHIAKQVYWSEETLATKTPFIILCWVFNWRTWLRKISSECIGLIFQGTHGPFVQREGVKEEYPLTILRSIFSRVKNIIMGVVFLTQFITQDIECLPHTNKVISSTVWSTRDE